MPGPGKYETAIPNPSPSFSLRSRPVEKDKSDSPGPGKYNPNSSYVLESPPSSTIPKSIKKYDSDSEKISKAQPGPGAYRNPTTVSGPKWGFGSSPRASEKEKEVPGPGAYNL